jgi:hypothetical protein
LGERGGKNDKFFPGAQGFAAGSALFERMTENSSLAPCALTFLQCLEFVFDAPQRRRFPLSWMNLAGGQCDQSATIRKRSGTRIAFLMLRLRPRENAAGHNKRIVT